MSADELRRAVMAALAGITHPGTGRDLVAGGHVQNVVVGEDGIARFQFLLRPEDPNELVKEARAAVEAVPGISGAKINVQLPQMQPPGGGGRRGGLKPGSVPAPTPKPGLLKNVRHVIAVSSGKGGVGKSMVAANLAAAIAKGGQRVGLLDADIYGPNIPLMFGVSRRPSVVGEKGKEMIEPLEAHGVRLMSLGFLLDKEQPAIMRGPLISGVLKQFLEQVAWGPLDLMVVDMPPGTGDAQLSLVQTIDLDGAVMVTTPQDVSTGDVRRGIKMFERVNTRVLGIVENMSGLSCPHCGEAIDVFGAGGGEALAAETKVPFLGRVPLDPAVREAGDRGVPTVLAAGDSAAGMALDQIAGKVLDSLAALVG
jgi:ATP-binding protein involved in chromosome partitioning